MARGKPGWQDVNTFETPVRYTCGYCGVVVASDRGLQKKDENYVVVNHQGVICICPHCDKATYFHDGQQTPGPAYGENVSNLPADVSALYDEARNCLKVSAYTAAALAARKLLMNVSASLGAAPNQHFTKYVTFLEENGYVPPKSRAWVDHIRDKGNEATHELPGITRPDAEEIISFIGMVLKLAFDYPSRAATAKS